MGVRDGVFNRLTVLSLAVVLCGCGSSTETSSTSNPTAPSTPTAPVDLITNGSSKASHTTHWHLSLGSTTATSDWAFFTNGTGAFRLTTPGFGCANQGIGDFSWTRLSSDALLVNLTRDVRCGPPRTNFSNIQGSFSSGTFTANLDGNATARTFALQSGALP